MPNVLPELVPFGRYSVEANDLSSLAFYETLRPRATPGSDLEDSCVPVHIRPDAYQVASIEDAHVPAIDEARAGEWVQRIAFEVPAGVPFATGFRFNLRASVWMHHHATAPPNGPFRVSGV